MVSSSKFGSATFEYCRCAWLSTARTVGFLIAMFHNLSF